MLETQLFVEALMDITPSSSFDEAEEWRDGFFYENPRIDPQVPLPQIESSTRK